MRYGYLSLLVFLAGCSNLKNVQTTEVDPENQPQQRSVGLDGTSAWYHANRAGAAYYAQAYKHVLAKRKVFELVDHNTSLGVMVPQNTVAALTKITTKSYTLYETRRWERFCGDAKMDSRDWDFIAREGRENIPEQLVQSCVPRAYTRQEYIAAWRASCDGGTPSQDQEIIIANSLAPRNWCQSP